MATHRYPVLVWRDDAGGHTAMLVGDFDSAAAYAPSAEEAVRQLKELLQWRFEHEAWNADPDLTEPQLMDVKVELRAQYSDRRRALPCPETIWLRIPFVVGTQENGLRLCTVPHLDLKFNFQDNASLKSLVAHYVKDALQGLSPLELAGRLPPRNYRLEEIVLRDSGHRIRRLPPADRPELKVLFRIADPLLHDLGRKRGASAAYSRDSLSLALVTKFSRERANILLVGESGVGKSTVLLDAAKRLARQKTNAETDEDSATDDLDRYRFWRGSGGRIIGGMRYLGEWEERCEQFIKQLAAIEGIFCAENLLELLQVGGQTPGDSVGAFLLPYLQRGELRMAAEATPAEVDACRRLLPSLLDVFQVIHVPAFNDAQAIDVLGRIAHAHATVSQLEIQPGTIQLVHRLFKRFLPYTAFPGRAAHFVRSLSDKRNSPASQPAVLSANEVISRFIKLTGLPEMFLRDDLPLVPEQVREQFTVQIIGQPDATSAAVRLVTTIKTGLTDPGRPFGAFLFCGPTGVGKTAMAKLLANFCFGAAGQKERLVRLDLSEFTEFGAAQRFLEAPGGKAAPWVERVRRQPFCVVLLDEIEKAAPEIFDILLGMLDEGRLTDRFGRVTIFRSAIIILTSNLGSTAPASAGFASDAGPSYESEVAKFFRPEFFNRLDAVITFNPLTPADVERITRKELAEIASREGFRSAGIELRWSEQLVSVVAREGYDRRYGARPLQRALDRLVVTSLARWRLKNSNARDLTLDIDLPSADAELHVSVS